MCADVCHREYAHRPSVARTYLALPLIVAMHGPVHAPLERVLQAGCVSESVTRPIFAAHEDVDSAPRRERMIVTIVRGDAVGVKA